jgi:hypothetical protein
VHRPHGATRENVCGSRVSYEGATFSHERLEIVPVYGFGQCLTTVRAGESRI